MAILIVSGNLGVRFNAGSFENDPSTWLNYSPANYIDYKPEMSPGYRSNGHPYAGLYNGQFINYDVPGTPPRAIAYQKFNVVVGKKYVAYVRVITPDAGGQIPIAADASYLRLVKENSYNNISAATIISQYQVINAKAALVQLESRFTAMGTGVAYVLLESSLDFTYAGSVHIDQYEVYEYIDEVLPPSTLAINKPGSTILNASGPATADGSITVAITGGTGPFEYSKNFGTTWQPGNLFAGVVQGTYNVRVREIATPANIVEEFFTVPYNGALFDFTMTITNETLIGANDGKILFDVTGSGAPFQFGVRLSVLDLLPTYQSGNLYLNLPPNGYDVFVKDVSNNVVQKYAQILAGSLLFDKIYFSKNQITYSKVADSDWAVQNNYRLYNEVRVEDVNGSGTFTKKLAIELVPEASGLVNFQVRQAFHGVMNPTPPILYQPNGWRVIDRIKFFKHYTGELTGTQVVPPSMSSSLPNIVVWGGIDKFNAGLKTPNYEGEPPAPHIDFFTALPTTKKFMSWAPLVKMVEPNQEDYLNFFVSPNIYSVYLKTRAYYDDGTNQVSASNQGYACISGELFEIPSGPANSFVKTINPAKKLIKYDLWLEDAISLGSPVISEVRTYILHPFRYPNTRLFMFINSLGTFDVMPFYGAAQINNTFDREVVKKYLPVGYAALDGEKAVNNVTRKKKGNYSSGYFTGADSAAWLDYMNDFMLSPQVYEVTDGKRRPVIITDGSIESEDQNYKRFFRFTAEDAYDNNVYTP